MALCQGLHSGKLAISLDRSLVLSLSWLDSSSDVDAQSLTVLAQHAPRGWVSPFHDVVGEFGERWNLASHYPVGVTGNQTSAAVEALTCDIENGSVPIRQQHHSINTGEGGRVYEYSNTPVHIRRCGRRAR